MDGGGQPIGLVESLERLVQAGQLEPQAQRLHRVADELDAPLQCGDPHGRERSLQADALDLADQLARVGALDQIEQEGLEVPSRSSDSKTLTRKLTACGEGERPATRRAVACSMASR